MTTITDPIAFLEGYVGDSEPARRAIEMLKARLTPSETGMPKQIGAKTDNAQDIRQPEPQHVELANARQALREQAEEITKLRVERGELALKLAGAECFIEEQRKKGNIK